MVSGGCGARAVPLPEGTPCTVAGGGAAGGGLGRCVVVGARDGVCVPVARCGNGVVEPGEECDDDSRCCSPSCSLAPGALCSSSSSGISGGGECCDAATCRPLPPTTRCGEELRGFCEGASCVTGSATCRHAT